MSKSLTIIKRVAALILMLSFFLPLSQCSSKYAEQRPGTESAAGTSAQTNNVTTTDISAYSVYPWPSVASIAVLLLFAWPAVLQLGLWLKPSAGTRSWMLLELPLIALTLSFIAFLCGWGQGLRYGAFIASGAAVAYGTATFITLTGLMKAPRGSGQAA
ncbi:hypothetical protein [Undibacterium terreum]|uniref:Transmembrane protein n=1 Tax=Undibacterium terreum TaxID=1224302 RepID=A0A916U4F3_9BURK|nr:hypothetical protein [Undibacterium terreum]GGC60254.1 hypothetical protein GCM10011396_03930 [Undibacterium terreum]